MLFEEGEVFTWIRDRERSGENMVVSLKMLKECHRTGSKQAMIAEDIRTGKKYFVKVLFCNDLEQVYVEKEVRYSCILLILSEFMEECLTRKTAFYYIGRIYRRK